MGVVHGIHSLSRMNILRATTRLIFRGYSSQRDFMEGLSSRDVQDFYLDAKSLGTDLKIMDPRNTNSGSRSFMEGNLFTFHSDGINKFNEEYPKSLSGYSSKKLKLLLNSEMEAREKLGERAKVYENPNKTLMNFKEAINLGAFILSGGHLRNELYIELKKVCGEKSSKELALDPLGHELLNLKCVKENFDDFTDQFLASLPHMRDYLKNLNSTERANLRDFALDISLRPDADPSLVGVSELAVVAMIFIYSETLMVRFDENEDRVIDNEEIWNKVYPIFKNYLKDLALSRFEQDLDEGDLKATFAFIINEKQLPKDLSSKMSIWWKTKWHFDDYTDFGLSMDRGDIIKVFAAVALGSKPDIKDDVSRDSDDIDLLKSCGQSPEPDLNQIPCLEGF